MSSSELRSPSAIERNRQTSREAKRRRRGRCVDCGCETRYAGHRENGGVSVRCLPCANRHTGLARRNNGPSQRRLHELLAAGVTSKRRLFELGVSGTPESLSALLVRELAAGRVRRIGRGRYAPA